MDSLKRLSLLVALAVPGLDGAWAQAGQAPGAEASAEALSPPSLLEAPPPLVHPLEAAEAAALGPVRVDLVLEVGVEGEVARVSRPPEAPPVDARLEEAAMAYARALRFSPARAGGQPVAVRLPLSLTYGPPPEPPPAEALAQAPESVAQEAPEAPQAPEAPVHRTEVRDSIARQLEDSAEAVRVVELGEAHVRSADLGEVLRRTEGVDVRGTGALGAPVLLSLNGLVGAQVRVFVDGVPLELSGLGEDLSRLPVGELERVELYKGVVPLRLGADALGGAIHLVTRERFQRGFARATAPGSC
jgi:hypothetical protein